MTTGKQGWWPSSNHWTAEPGKLSVKGYLHEYGKHTILSRCSFTFIKEVRLHRDLVSVDFRLN